MEKILKLAVVFIFSFFLSACSDVAQEKNQLAELETLKEAALEISSKITWTEELERGRLSEKLRAPDGIGSKVRKSVLSVSAVKNQAQAVFPSLAGFGSLDSSLVPLNLKVTISSFFEAFSKNENILQFSKKESLYTLALFDYDLKEKLPEYFLFFAFDENCEASSENSAESTAVDDSKKSASSEKTQDIDKTEKNKKVFFDSCKIGQPFIEGGCYQVPLLLSSQGKILIIETFWILESSKWLLDQIQISDVKDNFKDETLLKAENEK